MAIEVSNLTKKYRDVTAVDGVSFNVPDATTFAFLGTNGAGKSTTIGCLTTVLDLTDGQAEIAGFDVRTQGAHVRENIGVVFQDSLLDPTLTVAENLSFRARINRLSAGHAKRRIRELAEFLAFSDFVSRPYGKLSGGQRRRVDIARALLHDPTILFLDEPTAGLDPASRATVWEAVHELRRSSGLTVFLTTHYMEETEHADQVCIIEQGRIIAEGTPAQLRARHSQSTLTVTSANPPALLKLAGAAHVDANCNDDVVQVNVPDADIARMLLGEHGADVLDFEFRHGRMDDVFLALTGRQGGSAA